MSRKEKILCIDYLTPSEIIEKYPELKIKFGWDARIIGILLKAKILEGMYSTAERKSYIIESSLIALIEFVNKSIESQKVDISIFK